MTSDLLTKQQQDFLQKCKDDPVWRICESNIYKIMIKGDNDEESFVIPFKPNPAQMQLIENFWHRNIILKARQLGFTTLVAIIWLDHALFNKDQRCGIIAHDRDSAEVIFRDKVKFAYENLPGYIRDLFPLARDSASELLFAHNNSSVRVATSMRSGTIHRLHISEFAKICAKYPDKAKEVITGSIPSVPLNGIIVIESTAEGEEGHYYRMTMRAKQQKEAGKNLTVRDYKFHFYPWWANSQYRMDDESVPISPDDDAYFDEVEALTGRTIDLEQATWYVATRDADFAEEPELMWQEYPSTPEEAFKKSTQGTWFAVQMTRMRKERRIKPLPIEYSAPCWTFWDIGNSDGTAIWIIQKIGHEFRAVRFFEAWGEPYAHAVAWLQAQGFVYDAHYLPHDATHVRQGKNINKSPQQMLEELMPGARIEIVQRIDNVTTGIQQLRDVMHMLWIDENECKEGIVHIDRYKKKFNSRQQRYTDVPEKADGHSEAADALRQFGQAYASGLLNISKPSKSKKVRNWRAI